MPLVPRHNKYAGFRVDGWVGTGTKYLLTCLLGWHQSAERYFSSVMWHKSSCHIYRSVPLSQVQAALNWILDWDVFTTVNGLSFSAQIHTKKQASRYKTVIYMSVKASDYFISAWVRGLK